MTEVREIPIDVVVSMVSGVLMRTPFGRVHEAIEHVLGRPVQTIAMGMDGFDARLRAGLLRAYPWLADLPDPPEPDGTPWADKAEPWLADVAACWGETVPMAKGCAA